jgi:hypothetical protein
VLIIKGERRLYEVVASGGDPFVCATAFWCPSADHAEAIKQVFGERELDA